MLHALLKCQGSRIEEGERAQRLAHRHWGLLLATAHDESALVQGLLLHGKSRRPLSCLQQNLCANKNLFSMATQAALYMEAVITALCCV